MKKQSRRWEGRWTVAGTLAGVPLLAGCDLTWSLNIPELGLFLNSTVGAILWAVANAVYFDLKRRGVHGFGRFAAFWIGNPATWITFFVVPEGSAPAIEPPPDDEEALFAEVRADRRLRGAPDGGPKALEEEDVSNP